MQLETFKIDNIKAIMIFLVVLGHFLGRLSSDEFAGELVKMIYLVHMPVFVFITGFLYRKSTKKDIINNLNTAMIPYFVFQILYLIFKFITGMSNNSKSFLIEVLTPQSVHWFLFCLFFWRLITPKIKYNRLSIFLILISPILIGCLNQFGDFLALSRLVSFYPYFFIGYHVVDISIKNKLIFYRIVGVLIVGGIVLSYNSIKFSQLTLNSSYLSLGLDYFNGIIMRCLQYIVSVGCLTLIIYIIPNKNYFFTYLGRRTLAIYLLHNYFIYISVYIFKIESILLYLGLSIMTTYLLGTGIVKNNLNKFIKLFYIKPYSLNKLILNFNKR